jgi:hypothetical protein
MNNYQKIAAIFIRVSGLTFMLSAILDLGIIAAGIFLISLEVIPRDVFAYETYFLQSFFFLIGGLILYVRSKSLANSIVSGLMDDKESAAPF